jgi:uncharacterized phiE125 gp8 family phage protein
MLKTPFKGKTGPFTFSTVDTGTNDSTDVLSTADAKAWMRVDTSADDSLIADLVAESIDFVEEQYGFQLIEKTVTVEYEYYGKEVRLPLYPVQSVTSVKAIDQDGTETTLTVNEDYYLTGDTLVIDSVYGWEVPDDRIRLKVVYVAGYTSIPSGITLGLKKLVASNYEDRQDVVEGNISEMPNSSKKHFKRYAKL